MKIYNLAEQEEALKKMRRGNIATLFWGVVIIVAIVVGLFITGCSSATWTDGTRKLTYKRLGTQKLSGLEIDMKTGSVKLGASEGKAGNLATALKNMTEIMLKEGK